MSVYLQKGLSLEIQFIVIVVDYNISTFYNHRPFYKICQHFVEMGMYKD